MIADHMQRTLVRLIEHRDEFTVPSARIGEISQLQNGIRLGRGHVLEECAEAIRSIVHHIMMQISDDSDPDRPFK